LQKNPAYEAVPGPAVENVEYNDGSRPVIICVNTYVGRCSGGAILDEKENLFCRPVYHHREVTARTAVHALKLS
jgi:hypothetical protein